MMCVPTLERRNEEEKEKVECKSFTLVIPACS
jgi:hypothetical protein